MRVPFAVNSYKSRSLPLSAQRLVNIYLEAAPPDAKMPMILLGTPGLKMWSTVGNGPIRGLHDFNGTLAVVSGGSLFTVDQFKSATSRGTVEGLEMKAPMASSDSELVVVSNDKGWTWNGSSFAQISDGDFLTPYDVTFQDGYHIFLEKTSRRFFISNLRDATAYLSTDRAFAEGGNDDNVAVIADHREVWIFGAKTTEVWFNTGDTGFPFERIGPAFMERGCRARDSVAKDDNSIFWLGDDLMVYRAAQYLPQRISTHAVEFAIGGYAKPEDAEGFTYTQEGHKFYVLNFDEGTWVYDISTGLWHERQGYGLTRWRGRGGVEIFGKVLVGDHTNGNIYELDLDTYQDNSGTLQRIAHSAPVHAETYRASMSRLALDFEAGVGLTTGQGSDPKVMLQWSDDGGRTWSNEHWRGIGKKGKNRARAVWRRMGQFRERVFRLTMSDPVKFALTAASLDPKAND